MTGDFCDIKVVPHAAAEMNIEISLLHAYAGTKCNLTLVLSKKTPISMSISIRVATVYFPF